MAEPAVVLVTAPTRDVAAEIVRTLVEERLAACGTILPGAISVYRWNGVLETADEVQIILKTVMQAVAGLTMRVRELHPYDVPEVLVLPVTGGLDAYLTWITANSNG